MSIFFMNDNPVNTNYYTNLAELLEQLAKISPSDRILLLVGGLNIMPDINWSVSAVKPTFTQES